MKRAMCGLLVVVALLLSRGARADIFAPAGDCSFGMPGQGGTRQMQAVCEGDTVQLTYTTVYQVCEMVTKRVAVEAEGETVYKDVAFCLTKCVPEVKTRVAPLDRLKAFSVDRKKIGPRQLKKRLAESTTVLVCEHDQKVDAAYLKLVQPDTMVLMLPPQPMVGMAVPAPAPSGDFAPPPPAAPAPITGLVQPVPLPPPAVAPAPPTPPPAPAPRPAPAALVPPSFDDGGGDDTNDETVEPPVAPDRGPPAKSFAEPLAAFARLADDLLQIRRTVTTTRQTTITIMQEVDGKPMPATSALNHSTRTEQSVAYSPIAATAVTKSGDELTADQLAERLANEVPVLVSADGQDINPRFLEIIRDDVILILVPISLPAPQEAWPTRPAPDALPAPAPPSP